jgi:hypothetical protein
MKFDNLCGAPEDEPGITREELEQTIDLDVDELAIETDDREDEEGGERPGNELAPEPLRTPTPARTKRKAQIDPSRLSVEEGIEISSQHGPQGRRTSAWIPLLQKMKTGDSVVVPHTSVAKMGYVRAIARSVGLSIVLRRADKGGVRLWLAESGDGL